MDFKEYLLLTERSFQTAMAAYPSYHDLDLPVVTKKARIRYVDDRINPIFVHLEDGTQLFFPYDDFKRIEGEPKVGKVMTVVLQRHPSDKSRTPSQIQHCRCD